MYLHGILHRIEGDVDNARCWYDDVMGSEVLEGVWGKASGAKAAEERREKGRGTGTEWEGFLDRVARWRDRAAGRVKKSESGEVDWEREETELKEKSLWELKKVLEFVERKFGTEAVGVAEAKAVWVQPDKEHGDKANAMIVGGEGWREF
jgi:hypothetical protein